MIIFEHPENFCGFLYFALVGIGTLVLVYLLICDLIMRIIKAVKVNKYEELYKTNKDFREYVDRYMRNKDVTLEEVLSLRQTQLVAEMYLENESDEQLVR